MSTESEVVAEAIRQHNERLEANSKPAPVEPDPVAVEDPAPKKKGK